MKGEDLALGETFTFPPCVGGPDQVTSKSKDCIFRRNISPRPQLASFNLVASEEPTFQLDGSVCELKSHVVEQCMVHFIYIQ